MVNDPALGPRVPGPRLELQALKRLVEDVFEDDVLGGFREYCAEEPAYADALSFLDECDRGGWRLLQRLVDCHNPQGELARTSAPELLRGGRQSLVLYEAGHLSSVAVV